MPSLIGVAAAAFGWGLLVGAGAGAAAGLAAGAGGRLLFYVMGAYYGAVVGIVIALPFAALGASGVADLARRQPMPLSPEGLAADLGRMFAQLTGLVLVAVAILAVLAMGSIGDVGFKTIAVGVAFVVAPTSVTVAILRRANRSLTRRLAFAHGWR